MLVQHSPTKFFQTCQDLEAFLFNCQQRFAHKSQPHWVSLTWELPDLDPLVAFESRQTASERSFYLENPRQNTAVAALGTTCHFTASGRQRFARVRQFIEGCTENATITANGDLPFSGLHFFCSFSFFDRPDRPIFPAACTFVPQWQIARHQGYTTATCNLALTANSNLSQLTHQTWQTLEHLRSLPAQLVPRPLHTPVRYDWRNIESFQANVSRALQTIQGRSLQKIVLSHAIDLHSPHPFNLTAGLNQLRQRYPDCYTFAVGNGCGQHFIGASPERLLTVRDGQLIADALAGSAPRGQTASADAQLADQLLSSPKERHEHRVVLHFIQQHLQQLGLKLSPSPPMRLLQLSNIQHLWTPVRASIPEDVHPLQVLAQLHPTPAVAGVPRHRACDAIREWESLDRQLYAAPLGWVNGRGDSEFIVGIRSALLDGDRARLYAGAGIVAGSDPQKELAEIQLKLQALLKSLIGSDGDRSIPESNGNI